MMMVVKLCVKAATAPLPLLIGCLLTNLLTNKPQEESVPIDHHIDRLIVICSFSPPPRHRQPTVLLGSGPQPLPAIPRLLFTLFRGVFCGGTLVPDSLSARTDRGHA